MSDETHALERPTTFREVFSQSEYRALYTASTLSAAGDYISKAAVTVLVYQRTDSVALSAAAFAITYLPWLVGGPLLAAVAERNAYKTVMIWCDVIRMVLIALVAIPAVPIWLVLALVFGSTLATPPSQAARSALMPLILPGDRLVLGLSLNSSTNQAAQVFGYVVGSMVATVDPSYALLIDAATFAASALIIRLGIRQRPPAPARARRHLLRETGDGFRIVFGSPVLRAIAVVIFTSMLFAIVPEGLAAAWAGSRSGSDAGRGFAQAIIMISNPVGWIIGSLTVSRFARPRVRQALVRPFAVLAPLSLVPALLNPPPVVVAVLSAICGFAVAGLIPVTNGLFVRALPHGFRARAFGVMATGVQVMQGVAVLATGLLADRFSVPTVVGLWSVAGVGLVVLAVLSWPNPDRFAAAIAAAERASDEAEGAEAVGRAGEEAQRASAVDRPGEVLGQRAPGAPAPAQARPAETTEPGPQLPSLPGRPPATRAR